jgi:hypothetical protein
MLPEPDWVIVLKLPMLRTPMATSPLVAMLPDWVIVLSLPWLTTPRA